MKDEFKSRARKVGTSLVITIPSWVVGAFGISVGDYPHVKVLGVIKDGKNKKKEV
jgi:hypothetical protein